MALKRRRGAWAAGHEAYTPQDAARALTWHDPDRPGDWTAVTRTFRDGHTTTWWAADACLGWWGPDGATRLVVATTDPDALPEKSTWYLATNLPRPGSPRAADSPHPAADLAEVVRIYGIRNWIEQSYKQVKDELGWADFQVRSDTAIRRHQTLVNCAFSFCWDTWTSQPDPDPNPEPVPDADPTGRPERGPTPTPPAPSALLATGTARSPQLADPLDRVTTLVAGMVRHALTSRTAGPARRGQQRTPPQPLLPGLTNQR
uniref:hypothetical protein n=1 Tax=Streptomyces acidicola TaxID=2596892 RepID=UPI001D13B181|nr:hypothetical protein [Streptomyces acidicola]